MNNKFKMLLLVMLMGVFALAMCACGNSSDNTSDDNGNGGTTGVANPFHETDAAGLVEATGISLEAPEGATDVLYQYCEGIDGSGKFAEVDFTLDGNEFCYRAQLTDVTSITVGADVAEGDEGMDAVEDLTTSLKECINIGAALAGMYYDWKACGTTVISNREAVFGLNEGGPGFVAWLDVVPGCLYSLSVDKNATQDLLQTTAEKIFVEMQGDSE